jgi:NAD(P)-dependent dehydrogenase (short-subunit alcohol dehydrogenase family)
MISPAPLTGRVALVTGGSMGIGRAIALGLAGAGADVAIHYAAEADRRLDRPDAWADTRKALLELGPRAMAVDADFVQPGAARRTVEQVREKLGGPDILVIAASMQRRGPFTAITRDDIDLQVGINFAATVELLQEALPAMAAAGWGRVLSIGSLNAIRPDPELAVYAALKAAQHNLIANLARPYAAQGVTLNTLSPGLIATDRNRWRREDAAAWQAIQDEANPLGRAGLPDELVAAALMFCSDAGAFVTGADLLATGGGHL